MADVYPMDKKLVGKGPVPCPLDGGAFSPASAGMITCPDKHEFTLCPHPVGLVRIDNVSFAERLELLQTASAAAELFIIRQQEWDMPWGEIT